jgi:hypothetical protein
MRLCTACIVHGRSNHRFRRVIKGGFELMCASVCPKGSVSSPPWPRCRLGRCDRDEESTPFFVSISLPAQHKSSLPAQHKRCSRALDTWDVSHPELFHCVAKMETTQTSESLEKVSETQSSLPQLEAGNEGDETERLSSVRLWVLGSAIVVHCFMCVSRNPRINVSS